MADLFFKHPAIPFAECRHSTDNGRHYKPHMHRTFCIGAIERGQVAYRINGETLRLGPGSLALINPETLHACNPSPDGTRSYYLLSLDPAWCLERQQSLWPVDRFCPVRIMRLDEPILYDRCLSLMAALTLGKDLAATARGLTRLLTDIFLAASGPQTQPRAPAPQVHIAKQQLGRDLDASLDEIARELDANPYTLLRRFKSATGLTPHAFRMNCRIEKARTLLQEGRDLSQVALECGFFDQSHFHRHFKAVTTVTPRAYQINFIQ